MAFPLPRGRAVPASASQYMQYQRAELENYPGCHIRGLQQLAVSVFMEETQEFGVTPIQHADLSALLRQPGVDQRVRLLSLTEEGRSQLAVAEPSVLRALCPMLEPSFRWQEGANFVEMLSLLIYENDEFARIPSGVAQPSAERKRSAAVKAVKGLTGKAQGSVND